VFVDVIKSPRCPKCGAMMALRLIEPERPSFDLRTFECPKCLGTEALVVSISCEVKVSIAPARSRRSGSQRFWYRHQRQHRRLNRHDASRFSSQMCPHGEGQNVRSESWPSSGRQTPSLQPSNRLLNGRLNVNLALRFPSATERHLQNRRLILLHKSILSVAPLRTSVPVRHNRGYGLRK
jgi:hypothetical protein